jgi:hypothetical protein
MRARKLLMGFALGLILLIGGARGANATGCKPTFNCQGFTHVVHIGNTCIVVHYTVCCFTDANCNQTCDEYLDERDCTY